MQFKPLKSWTLSLCQHMSLGSALRYRRYTHRVNHGKPHPEKTFLLRMKYPICGDIYLREEASDIWTLKEIFLLQVYKEALAHLNRCHTFIDLGANIGLTSLHVASLFPDCSILAIEPHPDTYRILRMNLNPLIRAGRC